MTFQCKDLREHGVVLVPVGSPEYDRLLEAIQDRATGVEGSPPYPERYRPRIAPEDRATSAILLNASAKVIVGLHAVWHFETDTGHGFYHSRGMLSPKALLLPFGLTSPFQRKLHMYWNSIFPGSKRYIGESGLVGDNSDVRPPEDERWQGGIMVAGGGSGFSSSTPWTIRQVTLVLDGVFFEDGEFAGPDVGKMFEMTVAEAKAHKLLARIAGNAHEQGRTAAEILKQIEARTGVAPDMHPAPPHFRNHTATAEEFLEFALQRVAFGLARRLGEEQAVQQILSWGDVGMPRLRKAS